MISVSEIEKIRATVKENFTIFGKGKLKISPYNGDVTIIGECSHITNNQFSKIPFTFKKVTKSLFLMDSGLKTLENTPEYVGNEFNVNSNFLTSLKYCPEIIGKHMNCSDNILSSLQYAPKHINGNFSCHTNNLTNLIGAPQYVGNTFQCSNNPLTSLEGLPKYIGRHFAFTWNENLPLLRLSQINCPSICVYKDVGKRYFDEEDTKLEEILIRYQGSTKSRSRIMALQVALIEAGYESNAHW